MSEAKVEDALAFAKAANAYGEAAAESMAAAARASTARAEVVQIARRIVTDAALDDEGAVREAGRLVHTTRAASLA